MGNAVSAAWYRLIRTVPAIMAPTLRRSTIHR
ncbi:hypothetical protein SBADM41S_01845 [Streptomyces badius]